MNTQRTPAPKLTEAEIDARLAGMKDPRNEREAATSLLCRIGDGARMRMATQNAHQAGHAEGLRAGYTQGWRWGLACGAVVGALAVAALWRVLA